MTLPPLLQHVQSLGHQVFTAEPGSANGNLVIVRRPFSAERWDCRAHWFERDSAGDWTHRWWACSTWPTAEAIESPLHPRGTPIMVPGQYRGLWCEGDHGRGALRRRALVQQGSGWRDLKVRRVRSLDELHHLEDVPVSSDGRGINLHDASSRRGMASIGCPTLSSRRDLDQLLGLYRRGVARWGADITCTLI